LFLSFILIFVFWALDQQFRIDIKNFLLATGGLSFGKLLFNYKNTIIAFLTIEITLFLLIFFVKYNFTNVIITLYSIIYLFIYVDNISYPSLQNYNGGIKEIVATLNKDNNINGYIIGDGQNPQFTFYTDGSDIGWGENVKFRRLDPKNKIDEIYKYLFSNNLKNSYIIYEKSDLYLARHTTPEKVVPDRYKKLVETKEYILYILND
jgi:hypothetical protein